MNEPIKTGMYKGELITHEGHEKMLDEFYDTNGWDKKTSCPTYETLETLGLPEVAKKLREKSL
jgi:aldehyde:ferredoxin oxidoreductase